MGTLCGLQQVVDRGAGASCFTVLMPPRLAVVPPFGMREELEGSDDVRGGHDWECRAGTSILGRSACDRGNAATLVRDGDIVATAQEGCSERSSRPVNNYLWT
jgi:hypothetical protein